MGCSGEAVPGLAGLVAGDEFMEGDLVPESLFKCCARDFTIPTWCFIAVDRSLTSGIVAGAAFVSPADSGFAACVALAADKIAAFFFMAAIPDAIPISWSFMFSRACLSLATVARSNLASISICSAAETGRETVAFGSDIVSMPLLLVSVPPALDDDSVTNKSEGTGDVP